MPPTKTAEAIAKLQTELAVLDNRQQTLQQQIDRLDLNAVLQKLAVIEERVNKLEKAKEESDRRAWQFVLLFFGGLITLAINIAVSFLKK